MRLYIIVLAMFIAGCGNDSIDIIPVNKAVEKWGGEYDYRTDLGFYIDDQIKQWDQRKTIEFIDMIYRQVQECTGVYIDPDVLAISIVPRGTVPGYNGLIHVDDWSAYIIIHEHRFYSYRSTTHRHEFVHLFDHFNGTYDPDNIHASPWFDTCVHYQNFKQNT